MSARVFSWDWRQQPDMAAIAAAAMELSETGPVWMREIETGSDQYAWAVSAAELTDQQAWLLYIGEDETPAPEADRMAAEDRRSER